MTTKRCTWVSMDDPLMLQYHDREWGVPVHDDRKHFEFLVLESAQAGLSWSIDDPNSTGGRQWGRFRRPHVNRTRLARISNTGDSASSVRPSFMRTCRRSAW